MTPEEAASLTNTLDGSADDTVKQFLRSAPARDIQRFIHRINVETRPRFFHLARTALDIRLAEDAEFTALRLERHTVQLKYLTYALVAFTAVLTCLTFILVKHP
jgi:hypothetical protein